MARPLRRGAALSTSRRRVPIVIPAQEIPVAQNAETDEALVQTRNKSYLIKRAKRPLP